MKTPFHQLALAQQELSILIYHYLANYLANPILEMSIKQEFIQYTAKIVGDRANEVSVRHSGTIRRPTQNNALLGP